MKIAILGTSGSGKSTLAQTLGATYHAPVLHLDTVHFLPGWVERPLDEENAIVRRFLDTHESWIIDGNYTKTCYDRRLEEADQIIVLDDGHVVGTGTHEELLRSCPAYLEIAQSQLSAEELGLTQKEIAAVMEGGER